MQVETRDTKYRGGGGGGGGGGVLSALDPTRKAGMEGGGGGLACDTSACVVGANGSQVRLGRSSDIYTDPC